MFRRKACPLSAQLSKILCPLIFFLIKYSTNHCFLDKFLLCLYLSFKEDIKKLKKQNGLKL
jgi:hypothetical protein